MATYSDTADVAADETHRLIASNKVEGTAVHNREGERLGSVYNFMVDKLSGQVAYAVMSFGGFLGIGDSYHPLPWKSLTYDTTMGGYVVDLDRARLEGAPSYKANDDPWADRDYGRSIRLLRRRTLTKDSAGSLPGTAMPAPRRRYCWLFGKRSLERWP